MKKYHSHFSNIKRHDQGLLDMAIEEMLKEVKKMNDFDVIMIESDYCSGSIDHLNISMT